MLFYLLKQKKSLNLYKIFWPKAAPNFIRNIYLRIYKQEVFKKHKTEEKIIVENISRKKDDLYVYKYLKKNIRVKQAYG